MEFMDPCQDSDATMHFYIRALEHEAKFVYNMNSRPAYKDRRPICWPGKKKGPVAALAYKKAKARMQRKAQTTMGLPIGILNFRDWFTFHISVTNFHFFV